MDKKFDPSQIETQLYQFWEQKGYFSVENPLRQLADGGKKPFSIILPPPNANANLHLGHAMYVYEDIMIRYHKLIGDSIFWLPGADHAGIETQYVFEKYLSKEGKSRFDYQRDILYQMIWDFVHENRGNMEKQLRRLGFSLDWSKNVFTLDPKIIAIVYKTFKKLYDDGLVYRGLRLVNYCTKCGTGFSELEVNYVERKDPLYYLKYGPFTIATVRPETKFRDTALAVNPKDKRYKKWLGKSLDIQGLLGPIHMTVIADEEVDPKFGTGIMKVTPAHDSHDFDLGKKYNLPVTPIINFQGRMDFSWFLEKKNADEKYMERAKKYHGKKILEARALMVEDLKADGLLVKVDENYTHRIGTCYRSNTVLEPLPMTQWFVKIRPLADRAIEAVKKKKVIFIPKRFEKTAIQWLTNFHDWNISRQIVWGIRIPAYRCKSKNEEQWFVSVEKPTKCQICGECDFEQDTDTFDTWFSSAQWPFATLQSLGKDLYDFFYPTSVMETGYDILPSWVCRMLMIGLYMTDNVPFKTVFLHGLVRDKHGQKMSKSKGNVINPIEMIDKYGADSLRAALIFGIKEGNDTVVSEEKIIGMRNFSNKIWNIGRFLNINQSQIPNLSPRSEAGKSQIHSSNLKTTKKLLKESELSKKKYLKYMASYKFSLAFDALYHFIWHRYADFYIEELKEELQNGNIEVLGILKEVYFDVLIMLHPFIPFVTDAVWRVFHGENKSILNEKLLH